MRGEVDLNPLTPSGYDSVSNRPLLFTFPKSIHKVGGKFFIIVWRGGAVVRALDLRLKGRGFKSQPLHCRVQLWTSCSHTLSCASEVTTLWHYINQFKFFFKN